MEFGSVIPFLENGNILVTGATGFIAKLFVEKILRVQPKVNKIYLLLRAADSKSALERLQSEIIGKDLFRVLKEHWGSNLDSFISEKIVLVPGDISVNEDLGIKDPNLKEEMWNQLDVVVNSAATTNFDERYDVAFGINTLGAKHVLCFAKKCLRLKVLVHVSTAYVCGEKSGLILETPYTIKDTLTYGVSGLDIDLEKKVIEQKLNELKAAGGGSPDAEITMAMKDLGMKRAKMCGWPNTYVFTKAMAEKIKGQLKENLSVVTIRPTMVNSTLKEPFPGWIEGLRTTDVLFIGYAKGRLKCFPFNPDGVIDVIPADMVVNAMLVAMVSHANQSSKAIYQIGSSKRNPLRCSKFRDYGIRYFKEKPWIGRDGKPVKVNTRVKNLSSIASFRRYMALRYLLLLQVLAFSNAVFCNSFDGFYTDRKRKVTFVMRLIELYGPYLFFAGVFDDTNTEKLQMAAKKNSVGNHLFYFDPKTVNWEDYFSNVHIPGLIKYVCNK